MISLAEAIAIGRGAERPFTCPAHENGSITASVNVMKGVWYCYSCHAHGTLDGVIPTADETLAIMAGETEPRRLPDEWLDIFDADHSSPYWVSRVGVDVAWTNRCGTDLMTGAPTYPMRASDGLLVGVVTRHANLSPKYMYPRGVSTSRALYMEGYNDLRTVDVLVLVEGAGDVMALQQGGLPDGWATAGCYGAGLHIPQVEIVAAMNPRLVIASFDDDEAGQRAIERSTDMLNGLAPVLSHRWSTFGGKDPGEVDVSQRTIALLETVKVAGYRP